jgi:predicted RNA-binding Zn ribbon-like protein
VESGIFRGMVLTRKRQVTGENVDLIAPQPGGRRPAPGPLATVQAFLNSSYDLGATGGGDLLAEPVALHDWLAERGLLRAGTRLDRRDLDRALAVREGLRALAYANNGRSLDTDAVETMQRASEGVHTGIRIDPDGPRFLAPEGSAVDGAIGALLGTVAAAMLQDEWPRLKACLGQDCGWAFYDRSRNQSARWCAMRVCGDRTKARAYYRRKTHYDER